MKKIAILIAGEYREFETAFKSWKFQDYFDVDYYIATWETSYQFNEKLNINIKESVKKETILKIIPNCKGISIGSSIQEHFIKLKRNSVGLMVNRWLAVIQLMNNSGIDYDGAILMRPDLYIKCGHKTIEQMTRLQDNIIYIPEVCKSTSRFFIQDQIFLGSQKTIEKLTLLPDETISDIHAWLASNLYKIYENIERLDIEFGIIRPNCRGIEQLDVNVVNNHAEIWFRTKNSNLDIIIKEFSGFSGSKVFLIKNLDGFFIRKIGNIERNYEKMKILKDSNFLVPNIIYKSNETLDMEYILGIDMKTFLRMEDTKKLTNFIILTMKRLKDKNSVEKDYTDTYYKQLSWIRNDTVLPFTIDQLIAKLPKILPSSMCHGDFTLDNIIYKDPNFFMIDPSTGDYDSWMFDIAKLRQDLDGKWFVRNSINHGLEIDLNCIKEALKAEFPEAFNDYLYILMLLRVYKYSQYGSKEYTFLLEEIKKIWK